MKEMIADKPDVRKRIRRRPRVDLVFALLRYILFLYICLEIPNMSWFLVHHVFVKYFHYIDPYYGSSLKLAVTSSLVMGVATLSVWFLFAWKMNKRYSLLMMGVCSVLIYLCIVRYLEIGWSFLQAHFILEQVLPYCMVIGVFLAVYYRKQKSMCASDLPRL